MFYLDRQSKASMADILGSGMSYGEHSQSCQEEMNMYNCPGWRMLQDLLWFDKMLLRCSILSLCTPSNILHVPPPPKKKKHTTTTNKQKTTTKTQKRRLCFNWLFGLISEPHFPTWGIALEEISKVISMVIFWDLLTGIMILEEVAEGLAFS